MANTLTNIMPKIIARGLMVLREVCIMPRLVNSDFSADARRKGQTIDVPVPSAVGTQAVSPSSTPQSPSDISVPQVQIPLDQWRKNDPIYLTDKEMLEIDSREFFLPTQMEEAVRALANEVNQYLFGLYKNASQGIYGVVGTAGTTPFGSTTADATNARKLLNKQTAPKANRVAVLDFDAEANALGLSAFQDAEKVGSAEVKIEGEIGRKFGINWNADGDVVTHTAGTIDDGGTPNGRTCAVDNSGGYAIGVDTIDVDNGAESQAAGTIVLGDIITFAGHDQTYCVVANTGSAQWSAVNDEYTFSTNAISGLKFYPALTSAVADDEVITVTDTHVVNLAMHRDAFGFAQRQLETDSIGTEMMTMTDPQTGLGLRLEVVRQNKQMLWEFDLLYGGLLVRPELAVRIMG